MGKVRLYTLLLLAVCAILLFIPFDMYGDKNADIFVFADGLSSYGKAVTGAFPDYETVSTLPGNLPAALEANAVSVEAYDFQAAGYLKSGAAKLFYPHYLATMVIAVDRDRIPDLIAGWADLLKGTFTVSLPPALMSRYAVLAMSEGLDGGTYAMTNALKLVSDLNAQGRIITAPDSAGRDPAAGLGEAPVAILFDFEAASLIKAGGNIELIIPCEGTLSFAGGLLCDTQLFGRADMSKSLLSLGFRLPDGRCDPSVYPADYSSARQVVDFEAFNLACRSVPSRLRREGWGTFKWTTADGDEHALSFLVFFFTIILWGGSVYMRTSHKGVRRIMSAIIALLLLRVALRYVKTLFGEVFFVSRFIWYCYYIPLALLPALCLWLAYILDRPEHEISPPMWWLGALASAVAIIILTLTNDLHQLVFTFNPGFSNWMRAYELGPGYHLFLVYFSLCSLASVVLLASKAKRAGTAGLMPLLLIVFLGGLFMAADYAGVPAITQMQIPFVSAVLFLLFFETALRTGFIPCNSRYGELFAALPMDMALRSNDGTEFIRSNRRVFDPFTEYRRTIRGGEAVLRADLSAQHALQASLEEKRMELVARNKMLGHEQKLKDELITLRIQNNLFDEVESTVRDKVRQISDILATIPPDDNTANTRAKFARAAVLTCYVKCRSNLLLSGKEMSAMKLSDLTHFFRHSAECALSAGVDCFVYTGPDADLPYDRGTAAYEIFEHFLECALRLAPCDMTVRLTAQSNALRLTVLLSAIGEEPLKESDFAPNGTEAELMREWSAVTRMTVEEETLVANIILPTQEGVCENE